jgi:MFS family permease
MPRSYLPGGRVPPAARLLALVILCTSSLMVILDGTIVTVALPTIQADLGFTAGNLSWVMNSYLIAFGGLLLLSGRLGDLLGRKRLFLAGIAVFVLASLACGLATGPAMLITARFVQGAGAAMASSVTLGMIVRLFDQPAEQGRAIGAFAFTGAVGASAGLISGGLLVQYASWHWIFFVNLPVGLAAWLAAWRVLPDDQRPRPAAGRRRARRAAGDFRDHARGLRYRLARGLVGRPPGGRPARGVRHPSGRAPGRRTSRCYRCASSPPATSPAPTSRNC